MAWYMVMDLTHFPSVNRHRVRFWRQVNAAEHVYVGFLETAYIQQ